MTRLTEIEAIVDIEGMDSGKTMADCIATKRVAAPGPVSLSLFKDGLSAWLDSDGGPSNPIHTSKRMDMLNAEQRAAREKSFAANGSVKVASGNGVIS